MARTSALPRPALANGDRLSRSEFERRYAAMPEVKKAELIEGVVYMPSPVHATAHGEPHAHVMTWLGVYAAATPHVHVADNATVRLDLDNEPQPDALLRIDEGAGGLSHISDDDYIEGPPELIVEIAHSSAAYDLHGKKQAYRLPTSRVFPGLVLDANALLDGDLATALHRVQQATGTGDHSAFTDRLQAEADG